MALLPKFTGIETLRSLSRDELAQLSNEIRNELPRIVHDKKPHLEASLAVTELTLALHYSFDTPRDILIWDVGHQAYVHKFVTDRTSKIQNLRKPGGLSGFTSRAESKFDPFGAGHSSTSLSALAGMAVANQKLDVNHVAVIGDGALTAGISFEALNHIGHLGLDVLVVFNDNLSSIDENIGALQRNSHYRKFFQSLGFTYYGPIEGRHMEPLLEELESMKQKRGPRVLHVMTHKENHPAKEKINSPLQWQDAVGNTLIDLAHKNQKLVVVTPAMKSGSGLGEFAKNFPDRFFDVGIAEQHAVTFSAGLAAQGLKPVCVLYSTFAQRAIDQIIHDVALQKLPVTFLIDRAGIVGEDGPTHHGVFDIPLLRPVPNLKIFAPASPASLASQLSISLSGNGPVAIRYPRGPVAEVSETLQPPNQANNNLVLALGSMGATAIATQKILHGQNKIVDVAIAETIKPLDERWLHGILKGKTHVVTLEDGQIAGGFGEAVVRFAQQHCPACRIKNLGWPDAFIPHGSVEYLYQKFGLDAESIAKYF